MSEMAMEGDPVVKEIDVYLSQKLMEQLYLLQYPVRPAHMTYDTAEHLGARIKPKQHKVELEIAVETRTPNYNNCKGEEIASNVDGRSHASSSYFKSNRMDKQVLTSTAVGCDVSRYAIGALKNGQLHITPLKAIVQLRPSFSYLDTADVRAEAARAAQAAERAAAAGESSQDEEEARPVVAKFARHETDEAKARRMASYDYMKHKNDEEPWTKLYVHDVSDLRSDNERQLLHGDTSKDSTSLFSMTNEQYLDKLVKNNDDSETTQSCKALSMKRILKMPLSEQIKTILMNVGVIKFDQLLELILVPGVAIRDVLLFVQQVAVLIQGCWVVKSSLIYPQKTFSAYNKNLSAEVLGHARDFILWKFSEGKSITRKELSEVVTVTKEDEREMLEQLAVRREGDGWKFKLDFDESFVADHPEVVSRQKQLQEAKVRFLCSTLSIDQPTDSAKHRAGDAPAVKPKRRKSSSSSRRKSTSLSMDPEPDEAGDAGNSMMDLNSSLIDDLVQDGSDIPDLRDLEVILGHDQENQDELDLSEHRTSTDANGVMESSSETSAFEQPVNEQIKLPLVEFVRETLKNRSVLSLTDLKVQFAIKLNELPPGHILGSGVSDYLLELCLKEVGVGVNSLAGESMYIQRLQGDELDYIREVVVDLLVLRPIIRITNLRKKLEGKEPIPKDDELKKVLKEYCVTSGGSWHLKGVKGAPS